MEYGNLYHARNQTKTQARYQTTPKSDEVYRWDRKTSKGENARGDAQKETTNTAQQTK
jgi:hypothetical protein